MTTPVSPSTSWQTALGALNVGANLFDAFSNRRAERRAAHRDEKWRNVAQSNFIRTQTRSVQDRVADAKAAGISPLAALGVTGSQLPNFSPARSAGSSNVSRATEALSRAHSEAVIARERSEAHKADMEAAKAYTESLNNQKKGDPIWQMLARSLGRQVLGGVRGQHVAEAEAAGQPGRIGLYRVGYDNRSDLGPLGEGEVYIPVEEVAESLEGTGGLGVTAFGNFGELSSKHPAMPLLKLMNEYFKKKPMGFLGDYLQRTPQKGNTNPPGSNTRRRGM